MAISIQELIKKKEEIQRLKSAYYDIKTSIGTLTVRQLTANEIIEFGELAESDINLIYEATVEPDLKDKALQEAYQCGEPTDIVKKLFRDGEINAISMAIIKASGFENNIEYAVHEELKN